MRFLRLRERCGNVNPRPTPLARPDATTGSRSMRDACTAGTTPNSRLAATEATSVKASTRPSIPISAARGSPSGASATNAATPQRASTRPAPADTAASSRLSVINCATIRPRPAPSAARTASSLARPVARAISRFATFAHAINNTRPTAPNSSISVGLESPTSCSRSGTTAAPFPTLLTG